jgi:hypothetical protein
VLLLWYSHWLLLPLSCLLLLLRFPICSFAAEQHCQLQTVDAAAAAAAAAGVPSQEAEALSRLEAEEQVVLLLLP